MITSYDMELNGTSVLLTKDIDKTPYKTTVNLTKLGVDPENVTVQCRQRVDRKIATAPWEPVETSGEFSFDYHREYRVVVSLDIDELDIDDNHPRVVVHAEPSRSARLALHFGMFLCDGKVEMGANLNECLDWDDVKITFLSEPDGHELKAMRAEMTFYPHTVTIGDNWKGVRK